MVARGRGFDSPHLHFQPLIRTRAREERREPGRRLASFGSFARAVNPSDSNVMYAGTDNARGLQESRRRTHLELGERCFGRVWHQQFMPCSNLVIDPSDPRIVFAAARGGVFASLWGKCVPRVGSVRSSIRVGKGEPTFGELGRTRGRVDSPEMSSR